MKRYLSVLSIVLLCIGCNTTPKQASATSVAIEVLDTVQKVTKPNVFTKTALEKKVFEIGDTAHFLADSCTLNFECDCCMGNLIFNKDTTFYSINYCTGDKNMLLGSYQIENDTLTLNYNGTCINQTYNWSQETNLNAVPYFLHDTMIPVFTQKYTLQKCKNTTILTQINGSEKALETTQTYDNIMINLADEGFLTSAFANIPLDNFNFDKIPADTLYIPTLPEKTKIQLLIPGEYHEDEIAPNAANQTWFALYNNNTLKKTPITVTTVHDAIVDEENENTGKRISVANQENCIALISGITLKEGSITTSTFTNEYGIPGDTILLNQYSTPVKLYATGFKKATTSEFYILANYKLHLSTIQNEQVITQTIFANGYFDDAMIEILWIGDLDSDNKPDFIIDISNHYNASKPTLFLSSEAKPNELVKAVAYLFSVGC